MVNNNLFSLNQLQTGNASTNSNKQVEEICAETLFEMFCFPFSLCCGGRSKDSEYRSLPLKGRSVKQEAPEESSGCFSSITGIFNTISNSLSDICCHKSGDAPIQYNIQDSPTIKLPDDMTALNNLSWQQAYITFKRYRNEHLIWGRPKGLCYGNFIGAGPDDDGNLYPSNNTYFDADIIIPPGASLTIKGVFPHSRYGSVTIADKLGDGKLGNGDYLTFDKVEPDPGSLNPFDPSNTRDVTPRNYTLHIVQGKKPRGRRATNTLYTGTNFVDDGKEKRTKIRLRSYVADFDYDGTGVQRIYEKGCDPRKFVENLVNGQVEQGLGLPEVILNMHDGRTITGPSLVNILRAKKDGDPPNYDLNQWLQLIKTSDDPRNAPCMREPMLQRFWNTNYNVTGAFEKNLEKRVRMYPATDDGGFSNNPNTPYLLMSYSLDYGEVVVIRGKKPTHPVTRHGEKTLPKDPQVGYFSISTADAPPSAYGDVEICDESIPVDKNGNWTAVISWPVNRPKNAKLKRDVVWLNPGAGEGRYVGARIWVGVFYIRYQNPSPNWKQSPANIPEPTPENPIPQDPVVMGEYYPRSRYMSKLEFEEWWDQENPKRA